MRPSSNAPSLVAILCALASPAHAQWVSQRGLDNRLDEPAPTHRAGLFRPAALDLFSGRANRVPVSRYFFAEVPVDNPANDPVAITVETRDCLGDPAMVVRALDVYGAVPQTAFNDDVAPGDPESRVDLYARSDRFQVFVFSKERQTVECSVVATVDGVEQFLGRDHAGGTLVELGPLADDWYVEVLTPDDGFSAETDTEMLLFDIPSWAVSSTVQYDAAFGSRLHTDMALNHDRDHDPRIPMFEHHFGFQDARNFVLIGKSFEDDSSTASVETHVDLVRGPLNEDVRDAAFPVAAPVGAPAFGDPIALLPGRYTAWLYVKTSRPVGDLTDDRTTNPTTLWDQRVHHMSARDPRNLTARGVLNQDAFDLRLQARDPLTGGGFVDMHSRKVPLGALGAIQWDFNRFLVSFEVTLAGEYRLGVSPSYRHLEFGDRWKVVRNADTSEVKVASWNMLYYDPNFGGSGSRAEYRNAANLLVGRGTVDPATSRVEEPVDQAPLEWQSDVAVIQENKDSDLFDAFQDEAETRGAHAWSRVEGRLEWVGPVEVGNGAVFVSDRFWPEDDADSINFERSALIDAGCSPNFGPLNDLELPGLAWCHTPDGDTGRLANAAIPARIAARRNGLGASIGEALGGERSSNMSADRPIAVFNLHLESGDDGTGYDQRRREMESLMGRITQLVDAQPCAFNKDCEAHAVAEGNRIVILGDVNAYPHRNGEHYWLLRRLREHFGYAVDVAMATDRSVEYAFGMHNWFTRVNAVGEPEGGLLGPNDLNPLFMLASAWRRLPAAARFQVWPLVHGRQSFPWWSRTFRGTDTAEDGGSERHDFIFLVGRGWAFDDAVRSYAVKQDNVRPGNPFGVEVPASFPVSGNTPRVAVGVEMYHLADGNCAVRGDGVDTACVCGSFGCGSPIRGSGQGALRADRPNYRPHHDVGNGTRRGSAAVQTDHRPIAARLRIFTPCHGRDGCTPGPFEMSDER